MDSKGISFFTSIFMCHAGTSVFQALRSSCLPKRPMVGDPHKTPCGSATAPPSVLADFAREISVFLWAPGVFIHIYIYILYTFIPGSSEGC